MHFYQTERVALFIDGVNLYATAKSLEFDIDYRRLLMLFSQRAQLVRAFYYTALAEDQLVQHDADAVDVGAPVVRKIL